MSLSRCNTIWGNDTLIRSAPLIEQHRDVIFVPFAVEKHFDHDPSWGIFDSSGRLIDAACYYRGADHKPVCQAPFTPYRFEDLPEAPEAHYVYGGPIIHHYGHFITTTLSRLWSLSSVGCNTKVLFHSHGDTADWLSLSYRKVMLNSVGITTAHLTTFDRPTRIRKVTIPRVALEEQNYVHAIMAPFCHEIGKKVLGSRPIFRNDKPLYFSKTGLTIGVVRVSNELDTVNVLMRNGVDIMMPETMSLSEQLYEFATRTTIVGLSSSAFHTSIFLPPCPRLICIQQRDLVNSNFILIDKANKNRAEYVFPDGGSEDEVPSSGFMQSARLRDPVQLAEDILRMI